MNEERIRAIANAASEHAESTVSYYNDTDDGLDYPAKMLKVRDLKFAELLVRECTEVIQREVSLKYKDGVGETEEFMGGHYAGSVLSRVKIKTHFGVE